MGHAATGAQPGKSTIMKDLMTEKTKCTNAGHGRQNAAPKQMPGSRSKQWRRSMPFAATGTVNLIAVHAAAWAAT
jgi:hypothetical protein